jgi:hypothetical protein
MVLHKSFNTLWLKVGGELLLLARWALNVMFIFQTFSKLKKSFRKRRRNGQPFLLLLEKSA